MNSDHISRSKLNKFLKPINFAGYEREMESMPKSSFLFVTYNRCPYKNFDRNPLVWAFQSLINNRRYEINDYVVIDDCSTDYTRDCIRWLSKKYDIKIRYFKNRRKKEYSHNRRMGIYKTKNNLVFMGDDDCIYAPEFLAGSMLTHYLLEKNLGKSKIAVINLPAYEKSIYPKKSVQLADIGKVFLKKTYFRHEFDKFPKEYLRHPRYINKKGDILEPIEVDTFKGVNLCNKTLILNCGNYMDLSEWNYGYSEHIELSRRINTMGYLIFHQPDPRISCIHLQFGKKQTKDILNSRLRNKKILGLKYSLGKMVDLSEINNLNTGARDSVEIFHFVEIGSFFSFYLKISTSLGLKFAINQYKFFVLQEKVYPFIPKFNYLSKEKRKDIFYKAIQKGLEVSKKQSNKKFNGIYKKIIKETQKLCTTFS